MTRQAWTHYILVWGRDATVVRRREDPGFQPTIFTHLKSRRGSRSPPPGLGPGRWRIAPDGVWPGASTQVGWRDVTATLHRSRPASRTPSGPSGHLVSASRRRGNSPTARASRRRLSGAGACLGGAAASHPKLYDLAPTMKSPARLSTLHALIRRFGLHSQRRREAPALRSQSARRASREPPRPSRRGSLRRSVGAASRERQCCEDGSRGSRRRLAGGPAGRRWWGKAGCGW